MALLGIFFAFIVLIALVIFLPVINGIGTYKKNDSKKFESRSKNEEDEYNAVGTGYGYNDHRSDTGLKNRKSGYTPYGEDENPGADVSEKVSKTERFKNILKETESPFKFAPATPNEDTAQKTVIRPGSKAIDASQSFNSNIDNDFDYDKFIEEAEYDDQRQAYIEQKQEAEKFAKKTPKSLDDII